MATEAMKRAFKKYYQRTKDKKRVVALRFDREEDADVLAKLDAAPNKTEYVRMLVRGYGA